MQSDGILYEGNTVYTAGREVAAKQASTIWRQFAYFLAAGCYREALNSVQFKFESYTRLCLLLSQLALKILSVSCHLGEGVCSGDPGQPAQPAGVSGV